VVALSCREFSFPRSSHFFGRTTGEEGISFVLFLHVCCMAMQYRYLDEVRVCILDDKITEPFCLSGTRRNSLHVTQLSYTHYFVACTLCGCVLWQKFGTMATWIKD